MSKETTEATTINRRHELNDALLMQNNNDAMFARNLKKRHATRYYYQLS